MSGVIPNAVPFLGGNEWKYLKECLDSNWVSSAGPFIERFEREVATYVGAQHAVATVNGTAALHLALLVAGVRPGRRGARARAHLHRHRQRRELLRRARRISCDSEPDSLGHRCGKLERAPARDRARWSRRPAREPRDRPADRGAAADATFGHPADLDALAALAAALSAGPRGGRAPRRSARATRAARSAATAVAGAVLQRQQDRHVPAAAAHGADRRCRARRARAKHLDPRPDAGTWSSSTRRSATTTGCPTSRPRSAAPSSSSWTGSSRTSARRRATTPRRFAAWTAPNPSASSRGRARRTGCRRCCWIPRPGATCLRSSRRRRPRPIELRPLWYPLHRQPVFAECEAFRVEHADALHARGVSLPCSVGITPEARARVVAFLAGQRH